MNNSTQKEEIRDNRKELGNDITNESLQKIARGAGIVFIGTIIGMLLGFVGRVMVVRYTTQSEYGIYSLAIVLINILATISALGLRLGTPRYIAYLRGKKEEKKIRSVISSSIKIALVSSIVFSLILFFSSNIISTNIFHNSELLTPLKILSVAIPFTVLIGVFTSIFQGFDIGGPKAYFQDILKNILFVFSLVSIILVGLSFLSIFYAYLASIGITCIVFIIYARKKLPLLTFSSKMEDYSDKIGKDLLIFSVPLLVIVMLNNIMHWTDTLMLGYFKTSNVIGMYNGALSLSNLLHTVLNSLGFIYLPIISGLYAKNLIKEIGKNYQIVTRWIFSVTIPLLFIFIIFPETVLDFLFGSNYIEAASTLRILAFGSIFHVFLGVNGLSLVAMGKTRFLLGVSLIGAVSNVVLNATLIPSLGIIGAALASLSSYWIINIFKSAKLYHFSKIHPFSKNYIKLIAISTVLFVIVYSFSSFIKIEFWMLPFLLFLFIFAYGLLSILTRSFDREDIELFLAIEKKIGINFRLTKRILRRFL